MGLKQDFWQFCPIKVSAFSFNTSCSISSATAIANNATAPYTYLWNPSGQTTQTATGLSAGTYVVTVRDSLGCFLLDTLIIKNAPSMLLSFPPTTNVDCLGNNTGGASVNVSGGIPSYSYLWNSIPVQTTQTASALYAGVYTVTVTDSLGCSFADTVEIASPTGLTVLSPVITNVNCFGTNSGMASVTAKGGTPGYTYSWNPTGQTTSTATGLTAGVYTVTITDNNGCIIKTLVPITQPSAVIANISSDTSICAGTIAGDSVIASGGTPGYTYLWIPTAETASSISVSPTVTTTYTAIVTDAQGCSAPKLFTTVNAVPYPTASVSYQPDLCGAGSVQFTDTATNTAIWNWQFGDGDSASGQNPVHIYPASGSYSVTLSLIGSLGCTTNNQLMVDVPPFSQLYIPTAFSPNDDGKDEVYYVFGHCITEMQLLIFDRWGEKVFETTDQTVGWDGRYKGQMENAGVFMYSFNGTLTTGEKINKKGNITLMR